MQYSNVNIEKATYESVFFFSFRGAQNEVTIFFKHSAITCIHCYINSDKDTIPSL